MRTPITYYGGKQKLASIILDMMPQHRIYVEPFFGGGAVFFVKPKSQMEVINDTNDRLISFFLNSRDNFQGLKSLIDSTLHSERMHMYAKDIYNGRIEATDLEKAWAVWLITNGSFGGSMHGGWKWCNGNSGGHSAVMVRNKRIEFSESLQKRLSDVQISCRDALRVIKDRDGEDTFFYLDPPYPGSVQQHYNGYSMNDFYLLLEKLQGIKGKFILSNFWSQTLKFFIQKNGWNYKVVTMNMNVASLGKRGGNKKTREKKEYLIFNYDLSNNLFS